MSNELKGVYTEDFKNSSRTRASIDCRIDFKYSNSDLMTSKYFNGGNTRKEIEDFLARLVSINAREISVNGGDFDYSAILNDRYAYINLNELEKMRSDALKWHSHVSKMQKNLANNISAEERSERARKAVNARWAKTKENKE